MAGHGHYNRRRRIDGDPRRGVGGAALAARHQVIAGGYSGSHGLNARGGHVADAIDGDAGGVGRAPGQLHLVSGRDHGGRGGDLRGGRGHDCRRGSLRRGKRLLLVTATGNSDQGDKQDDRNQNTNRVGSMDYSFRKFKRDFRMATSTGIASTNRTDRVAMIAPERDHGLVWRRIHNSAASLRATHRIQVCGCRRPPELTSSSSWA